MKENEVRDFKKNIKIYFINVIKNSSLRNAAFVFFSNAVGQLVLFLVSIFIANYFGKSIFGAISYAKTLSRYIVIIASFGFPQILARELIQDRKNAALYIANSLFIRFTIGSILLIGFNVYFFKTISNEIELQISVLYTINAFLLSLDMTQSYDAFEKFKLNSVIKIFANYILYLSLVLVVMWIFKTPKITYFVAALVISTFSYQFLSFYFFYKKVLAFRIYIKQEIIFRLMKLSFPFLITTILELIYMSFGIIWLRQNLGNDAVGVYSAAFTIISALIILDSSITRVLLPKIFSLNLTENVLLHKKQLKKYVLIKISYILPLVLGLLLLSKFIITTLYNEQYLGSISVLRFLLLWFLFQSFTPLGTYLYGSRHTRYFIIFQLIKIASLIILVILFVKFFNVDGAALAMMLSNLLSVVFLMLMTYRILMNNTQTQT